ncbi:type III-B CRISPR module RAMP protein Cmr1 [Bacillus pumilus]|jgi:CRISPR-associated protein Cmr1|uniref:type III-B CRISPR module RAMP protein Cmr1 n=1 Tax=Bacillus pumilus TaxID=1408 RepID=UPI00081F99D3|nr:type III-B CRISPR module RAMP protein Cmr1 [Bacillus pumilus]AOC57420.1 type III-B CRISPR module RAMP protein Cmr1 [Bacillus pumilus]MBR0588630.1 type III-B CRISPR module RAMP protein Cmr1 [Bacillus pumilus DW2J2]MBR0619078.1 type III-B CRISPR module RAMP protein Cmr1 [Bacillus pumilus]MBR0625742.1 type III-B CRISPR module RAMP protein Cmr1 [Bacillus pumilus]MCY7725127.1 type III-B CRISPR module RAMP protein Cmr1 [Bacillus pumilus]
MTRESSKPKTNWHDVKHAIDTKIHEDQRLFKEPLTIHLVTPMFGGGPQSNTIDQERPIRESAIRGHLRFWWRATRGATCKNANELSKREANIFGHTEQASQIQVVTHYEKDELKRNSKAFLNKKNHPFPRYVLSNMKDETPYLMKAQFSLNIRLSKKTTDFELIKKEVEAALWAWINFGGLGSRTRRGCGSLYCKQFSPHNKRTKSQLEKWFEQKLLEYDIQLPASSREWPTLSREFKVQAFPSTIISSWRSVIQTYETFRRRSNPTKKMGRSCWPEADTIRLLTGKAKSGHHIPYPKEKPFKYQAFPRAQFGLPIQFRFAPKDSGKDPDPVTLLPKGKDRLASPLILKPLAINQKESVGMIMVLQQPKIEALSLLGNGKPLPNVTDEQSIYPTATYSNNPLQDESGRTHSSAIQAFLHSKEVQTFCQKNHKNKH